MAVEFRVLGPVEAQVDGLPVELGHARQRWVLAALLVEANRRLSTDQLLHHVWGDRVPHGGRNSLYGYLSRLRRVLHDTCEIDIVRRPGGYELVVDQDAVDLHRFQRLLADARAAADDVRAAALFEQALGLWRGEVCADLSTPWVDNLRAELDRQRLAAELDHTDLRLRLGRHGELLADLVTLTTAHPLDERLAGQFLLALYRAGRQADALEHYHQLRTRLADDLGADPGPDLQRLHQRILTTDPTLANPTAGTDRPAVVPHQLPAAPGLFTGRRAELTQLDRALTAVPDTDPTDAPRPTSSSPEAAATVMISAMGGAGGIGKTWLALTWAQRNLHHFPDGQLFVDLHGFSPTERSVDPSDALRAFLTTLGAAPDGLPSDPDALAALYRRLVAGRRMLIVLDNAATTDQVVPLLPGTATCTVLVTSRNRLPALVARHGARPLHLDVLTDTESRQLLVAWLGAERVAEEERAATDLMELCGGFPLALGVVAARAAAEPHLPLADTVAELREYGLDALDDVGDPGASLPAVLSWSLRRLNDDQRAAFALLGVAPGPDTGLPAAAALTGLPERQALAALRTLVDDSLLDRTPGGRYAMHDLIRAYAAGVAHTLAEPIRQAALERVVDFYLHTAHAARNLMDPHAPRITPDPPTPRTTTHPLPDDPAALAWFDVEHPHLLAAQHAAATQRRHGTVWHLAWNLTIYHYRRGHLHDDLAVWQAALDATAHLPDPVMSANAHRYTGFAHALLEQHEEAAAHLNHALALAEHHHDRDQQAAVHQALATAWELRGDDRQALAHAEHALALYRIVGNTEREARALNGVGWFAARLNDYDTAREHCQAALALHRHHRNSDGEAATLDSLGYIDHQTGLHNQAIHHYNQALALIRAYGNTFEVAGILDRLGDPYTAVGHHDRARAAWQEALRLYREQGRDTDAERVQRQLDDLDPRQEPVGHSDATDAAEH
ncbi:BTAD domain-containing putative transcriptional regulator [Actinosynnema sp. NPDC050436]|uniref:AfsR/SARP family transcriptional regulator n=1 Tax=Actinosynnema sp. NPDC050436 TaxID=3155659 RepID=UPI00340A4013